MPAQPFSLGARGQRWLDVCLASGLLVVGLVAHVGSGMPVEALLTAAEILPLFWRRRAPGAVFVAVAAASALQAFVLAEPVVGQLAFPVAVYSVARWGDRWQALAALVVSYAAAIVAATRWLTSYGEPTSLAPLVTYAGAIGAIVTAAWALGFAGQQRDRFVAGLVVRAEQAEQMAQREVELAARDERARIAREMHDVVAHGLSVIVVQADGAGYAAAKDPGVAVATLSTIAATGRESLAEMRRLLGLLRDGDTGVRPLPGLADIPALVADARSSGTVIDVDLPETWPPVPDGVGLASYRVVQEALTNVRKHAGVSARVRLRVAAGRAMEIEIRDDGHGAATTDDGRGLGVSGMRERVAVHDGTLHAGPAPGGGFVVSARIPL